MVTSGVPQGAGIKGGGAVSTVVSAEAAVSNGAAELPRNVVARAAILCDI